MFLAVLGVGGTAALVAGACFHRRKERSDTDDLRRRSSAEAGCSATAGGNQAIRAGAILRGACCGTPLALSELKSALTCLSAADDVGAEAALLRGERALPQLCSLVAQASTSRAADCDALADALDILALLSPSRRGLQSAILDAGAVPPLLKLLAASLQVGRTLETRVLAPVLRTLVNLTSSPRGGNPVRLALLNDDHAVPALMRLLHVATEDSSASLAGTCAGAGAQLGGLAAFLVAHLCGTPSGQLQLVQEGTVPLLVRLVRKGRLAWAAETIAAAASAAVQRSAGGGASACPSSHANQSWARAARVAGGLGAAGGSLASSSSALLYDTAVAAAEEGGGGALPYVLAAVQYALMALVNITFDHSANQRAAALAGALAELDALAEELLQPGLLLEMQEEKDAGARMCGPAAQHQAGAPGLAEPSAAQVQEEDEEQQQQQERLLLRSCALGVAKFSVWLVAHLASSDPDLKAAIAGPGFSFVPKLLSLMLLQQQPSPLPVPPQQQQAPAAAAACDDSAPAAAPAAAAINAQHRAQCCAVQQYAAMGLVNLTCGVPSTKAVVAAALQAGNGWERLAASLQHLADALDLPTADAAASAAAAAATGPHASAHASGQQGAPPHAPVAGLPAPASDLLLYQVWLLQHLSLSPTAAAVADPLIVPPLIALLRVPDPHTRLRTVAALGALCSASGTPHRAAFLAGGGMARLVAGARAERDPHLLAYTMLCTAAAVGEDDASAVAEAVGAGALECVEALLSSPHPACLVPGAEALQSLARAARAGMVTRPKTCAAAVVAASAADAVPRSLLSKLVGVMLTHADPRVRTALNDALGAVTALPGVRERYCAVFAQTLGELVSAAEVELRVTPVN